MRIEHWLRMLPLLAVFWLGGLATAQGPSCKLFKHGTFTIPGDHPGQEVRLIRRGDKQKETTAEGHKSQYRVRWVDECTYLLFDRKVTSGEDLQPGSPTDTLTVHITDTWEFGYAFRATSNFADLELMGTMEMVIPKAGGFTIGM